ncbi:MAG TPA: PadR family transcriptional regulator [Vicinamibacterales bacterium]|jgi:DNA-binding PadR family transcriptional regulator
MSAGYLSMSATAVLQAIANGYIYGFDIMEATGLPSGTVYPALRRMEGAGLIASRWEDAAVAQRDLRPPRKYYALSRTGQFALTESVARYRLADRKPPRQTKPFPARR